jgi:RNA polymerase sigma factor (sigma-70 family)
VIRVADTEEQALSVAFSAARIRVGSAMRARSVPPADRDDLVQELAIACWRAAATFDPAKASLRTFIECVVANRLASAIRTARRRPAMQPLDSVAEIGIAPLAMMFDLRSDVASILDRLSVADRRVAVALMEYSPTEAGRNLKIARSTVYQHIGRLRARFMAAGITPDCMARNRC